MWPSTVLKVLFEHFKRAIKLNYHADLGRLFWKATKTRLEAKYVIFLPVAPLVLNNKEVLLEYGYLSNL